MEKSVWKKMRFKYEMEIKEIRFILTRDSIRPFFTSSAHCVLCIVCYVHSEEKKNMPREIFIQSICVCVPVCVEEIVCAGSHEIGGEYDGGNTKAQIK